MSRGIKKRMDAMDSVQNEMQQVDMREARRARLMIDWRKWINGWAVHAKGVLLAGTSVSRQPFKFNSKMLPAKTGAYSFI